jgi:hypothetical protein
VLRVALSDTGAETSGAAFNGGRNNPRKDCGDQNAKDACHNSLLLGADRSVVNRSSYGSGTSSNPQRKPQTGHRQ